jgi:hypothetical protein
MDKIVEDLQIQKGLPLEIIQIILRYTYLPQSEELMCDVKNFIERMSYARELYEIRWHKIEPDEVTNWLINDIMRFANSGRPTNLGSHPKMRDILSRFFMHRRVGIQPIFARYVSNVRCQRISASSMVNIFWGLLTCKDRDEFIEEYGAVWD